MIIVAATILQLLAAILATVRAVGLWWLPRKQAITGFGSPASTFGPLFLAAVLLLDCVNDWTNRLINAHLPPPGGVPLLGLARAAAHLGLALYAGWLCAHLAFVGWLARQRIGSVGIVAGVVVWIAFVATNVFAYPEIRGDTALQMLGALHIAVFTMQLPCLVVVAVGWDEKQETEQICSIWFVFLGVAAGFGPLLPWNAGGLDRVAAERSIAAAMTLMYAWVIATILAGGGKWIRCVTFWRSVRWLS